MMTLNYGYGALANYILFLFFTIIFICYQYNDKTEVALFDSLNMTYDWIWACPNWFAQNRCIDVENSLYKPLSGKCKLEVLNILWVISPRLSNHNKLSWKGLSGISVLRNCFVTTMFLKASVTNFLIPIC